MLTASAQIQVVHTAPNTTSSPQLTPLILADGSVVTHHWDAGEHTFRKYDQAGDLVWSNGYQGSVGDASSGVPAVRLLRDGTDGFRFICFAGIIFIPDSLTQELTTQQLSYEHGKVSGNGTMSETKVLRKTFAQWQVFSVNSILAMDAASTTDGGFVVSTNYLFNGASSTTDIIRLNANGDPLWSRSVGVDIGIGPFPTFNSTLNAHVSLAVSADGTTYWAESGLSFTGDQQLGALDQNGDLLWMKKYTYGNTSPTVTMYDIALDGEGNLNAAGHLSSSVGSFHFFVRTTPDGVLDRADLYRTPLVLRSGQFEIDGLGNRIVRVETRDSEWSGSHGILIADTLGSDAQFVRRNDQVVLPNNVFVVPHQIDVLGDQLAMSSLLNHEDVNFAFTTRYEALTTFNTGGVMACFMNDTLLEDLEVPLAIMTSADVPSIASVDISQYMTIEPIILDFIATPPETLDTLCVFAYDLLGINVGISDKLAEGSLPLLTRSLLPQGAPLLLNDIGVRTVEVFDTQGALIQQARLNGTRTLPANWPSGMYVVRGLNEIGFPLRTERLVVE